MNNNTILAGIIVGGAALAGAAAIAINSGYNPLQDYATVVSVAPAYDQIQTPRVVCGDEATLAAADTATLAGEDGGQAAPRCQTVFENSSVEAGFDVTYELDGEEKVVRMDRDPGPRIPVEDGALVLSQS